MPTADYSQTTRTKLLAGKELSKYHRLNPFSPQGGRYPFSQAEVLSENVGSILGGCCSTASAAAPAPPPAPGGGYTVTYFGNGNTGGSVPAGVTSYAGGSTVSLLGNSGSLTKSGVAVFAGWNTAADGFGTNYVGGDTFNIIQNTILYARWISAGSRLR
jgi:hypothetical protein